MSTEEEAKVQFELPMHEFLDFAAWLRVITKLAPPIVGELVAVAEQVTGEAQQAAEDAMGEPSIVWEDDGQGALDV